IVGTRSASRSVIRRYLGYIFSSLLGCQTHQTSCAPTSSEPPIAVGRRLRATGSKVRGFNEQIFGADEPRTGGKATKKHSALHDPEPLRAFPLLLGEVGRGFDEQIFGADKQVSGRQQSDQSSNKQRRSNMTDDLRKDLLAIVLEEAFGYDEARICNWLA